MSETREVESRNSRWGWMGADIESRTIRRGKITPLRYSGFFSPSLSTFLRRQMVVLFPNAKDRADYVNGSF